MIKKHNFTTTSYTSFNKVRFKVLSVSNSDFSITQILREINLGDCRSAKSAISTHLEALNLDFYEFLHFLKAKICQINHF